MDTYQFLHMELINTSKEIKEKSKDLAKAFRNQ